MKIEKDKKQHFTVGLVLSLLGIIYWPLFSLGFIFGILKEITDYFGKGTPDIKDILYTFFGAGIGTVIVIIYLILV